MVLHTRGRVGSRRFFQEALREQSRGALFVYGGEGLDGENGSNGFNRSDRFNGHY